MIRTIAIRALGLEVFPTQGICGQTTFGETTEPIHESGIREM